MIMTMAGGSPQTERQPRHLEVMQRLNQLEESIQNLWSLVFLINPGLSAPPHPANAESGEISFSEVWSVLPDIIGRYTEGIREATAALKNELF